MKKVPEFEILLREIRMYAEMLPKRSRVKHHILRLVEAAIKEWSDGDYQSRHSD